MSEISRLTRNIRSCVLAKPGMTNVELKDDYKKRSGRELPFSQFDTAFYQAMRESGCTDQYGGWKLISVDNPNTANLIANLSKMESNGRMRTRGSRNRVAPAGIRVPYNPTSSARSYSFTPATNQGSGNGGIRLETNFKYRDGFANELCDWPEDSPETSQGNNVLESQRSEIRDRSDGSHQANYPVTLRIPSGEGRNLAVFTKLLADSQPLYPRVNENSRLSPDVEPPGLAPGCGYRNDSGGRLSEAQRTRYESSSQYSKSSTVTKQPSAVTFNPSPPMNAKSISTVPVQNQTPEKIHYDELCTAAIDIFVSYWPSAMNTEELMNDLAKKTGLIALVGPNSMEHFEKIITMIHKNERSIFIETIDGDKVYSYIPGAPDASHENDLYEQVERMLCLILHTYRDMTIESAQSRLGFPDKSRFTNLKGCALIAEVSRQSEKIIIGPSTSGHGKDRKLSLKFNISISNLRSQVRILRRSTDFSKTLDASVVQRVAGRSKEDRIENLLSECEGYVYNHFPMYQAHSIAEMCSKDDSRWHKATMVYFNTLDKFAVLTDDDISDYESVLAYLQEDYEGIEWDEIFLTYIKEGAAVGIKKEDGKFARGVVCEYDRNPSEQSLVYLVDEGCLDKVSINKIFPLKDSMKSKHPLGIRCTIGAFRMNSEKSEKYYEEHREIWKTLNKKSFIEISPRSVVACGGKKEIVVELRFNSGAEEYHYPKDLIENNIINML